MSIIRCNIAVINKNTPQLEVCIDNTAAIDACIRGGADRIELCSALALGGLTPSSGLMQAAADASIPVRAMIRPRAGNFIYSAAEVAVMLSDIEAARAAGIAGIVFGAATSDGQLDAKTLQLLIDAAADMPSTLHRVIDTVVEPLLAVEQAIDLGFDCILSSGGAESAAEGYQQLIKMKTCAEGRITLMAGAGLSPENIGVLASNTGLEFFHSSCSRKPKAASTARSSIDFGESSLCLTDADVIRAMRLALLNSR